jgi:uncharacterized protein (DUF302 family)
MAREDFDVPYALTTRLANTSIAQARTKVSAALKDEGFGILTEIDVQATLKAKLGVESEPYVILGACNPELAHRALSRAPALGLLLPCNVVLAQDGSGVVVSAASPKAMFGVTAQNGAVAAVATDAEARLRRAIDALS